MLGRQRAGGKACWDPSLGLAFPAGWMRVPRCPGGSQDPFGGEHRGLGLGDTVPVVPLVAQGCARERWRQRPRGHREVEDPAAGAQLEEAESGSELGILRLRPWCPPAFPAEVASSDTRFCGMTGEFSGRREPSRPAPAPPVTRVLSLQGKLNRPGVKSWCFSLGY